MPEATGSFQAGAMNTELLGKFFEITARDVHALDPALFRLIRSHSGLSQAQVAAVLGVSRPTVGRWEAGTRKPHGEMLARYRAVLEEILVTRREGGQK